MITAPTERLSFREKFAYGLGDTASNFYFQAFNLFLFYYYTDIFGLSAAAVGWMILGARALDAVLDPLMGIVADRTNTRWGKFRPYLLWGALPYGVIGYLMFANPALSAHGKLIYACVTYSLMWVAYTAINIPYSALMGVMSPSSEDRTSLSTYRFACAFTGQLLIGSLVLPLKNLLGGSNPADGFRYTMALFSVVSVAMFLYTFFQTRERVQPPPQQDKSLKTDLRQLFSNGPWLVLFFAAFLTLANVGVRNASIIFYFKYIVGDESKFTLFSMLGSIAFIAGAMSTGFFRKFASRRTLMIWLTSLNALAMAAFYFVDPRNIVLLHVLNIVGTFLVGPTPAIVWSLYADTADFGEWKFGRRTTALVFSAAVFAQKVGLAVGSWLLGVILAACGFAANAAQGPRALTGILLAFSLIPAAFALLSGLAIIFYRLDDAQVRQVEQDLAARKGLAPAPVG
ncbi:MAG: sugar (Glycoside-Pentoside-Hexuronide) transporter [Verrucomicrobia bacterium]|nr:sugar (Glycoside-Pentoside-Hexuronide) transporter [Verrucomicrobiota bacterium]